MEVTCSLLFFAHQVCLKWAKTHGSKFAPKKYQLVHLTRRQKDNCERELDLGESGIIKGAKVGRLLGVLIDNKLSWGPHIEFINTKVLLSLGGLSCLAGSTWGGSLLTICRIFQAVIIPQITYCASVWYIPHGKKGHKKLHLKKLKML